MPPTSRVVELTAKLEAAVAADPVGFSELIAATPAGEPIPYDPRLGLTKGEYAEFLSAMADAEAGVIDQAAIAAVVLVEDRYELRGSTATGDLAGIVFDANSAAFHTPFGDTGPAAPWTNADPHSFLGEASGWQWEYVDPEVSEQIGTASGTAIKIILAVRDADGRVYLSVEAGQFEDGAVASTIDVDLLYEPSGP